MEETTNTDPMLRRAYVAVVLCGVVISAVFLWFRMRDEALASFAGTLLGLGNLYTLARAVGALLAGRGASWGFVVFVKFITLFILAYLLLSYGGISALGFSVGLGALPLGIVIASAFRTPAAPSLQKSNAASSVRNETDHA